MKKCILISCSIIICIVVSVRLAHKSSLVRPILDDNVEALSRSETPSGGSSVMCSKTGTKGKYRMLKCDNCDGSYGDYAMDEVAYCFL